MLKHRAQSLTKFEHCKLTSYRLFRAVWVEVQEHGGLGGGHKFGCEETANDKASFCFNFERSSSKPQPAMRIVQKLSDFSGFIGDHLTT